MSGKSIQVLMAGLLLAAAVLACGRQVTPTPQVIVITREVVITTTPGSQPQPQIATVLEDQFGGSELDIALWTFGTNSSGSGYSVVDGALNVWGGTTNGGGAWMHSNQLFTPGNVLQVFETRVRVTRDDGGDWGFWGDDHEGYLMFGVSEAGGLEAWVRENSTAPVQAAAIHDVDITEWHVYRIEFTGSEARFYVDDVLKATHTAGVPAGKPMHIRLDRVSWGQSQTIYVDYVKVGEAR